MGKKRWVVLLVGLALLAALLVVPPLIGAAVGHSFGWGMMGPGMMGGWGYGLMGGLGMVLFWVLVIGAIVWFVQAASSAAPRAVTATAAAPESPLDILKRRFALGEITKEQYDEMRRTLEG